MHEKSIKKVKFALNILPCRILQHFSIWLMQIQNTRKVWKPASYFKHLGLISVWLPQTSNTKRYFGAYVCRVFVELTNSTYKKDCSILHRHHSSSDPQEIGGKKMNLHMVTEVALLNKVHPCRKTSCGNCCYLAPWSPWHRLLAPNWAASRTMAATTWSLGSTTSLGWETSGPANWHLNCE